MNVLKLIGCMGSDCFVRYFEKRWNIIGIAGTAFFSFRVRSKLKKESSLFVDTEEEFEKQVVNM